MLTIPHAPAPSWRCGPRPRLSFHANVNAVRNLRAASIRAERAFVDRQRVDFVPVLAFPFVLPLFYGRGCCALQVRRCAARALHIAAVSSAGAVAAALTATGADATNPKVRPTDGGGWFMVLSYCTRTQHAGNAVCLTSPLVTYIDEAFFCPCWGWCVQTTK
eukprot:698475-Prorocentrum_minimum.AAC.1